MNIWLWIRERYKTLNAAGETRLASMLYSIPEHATNLRHAQVDAQLPEALALARAQNDPWLELFFRHWELQSRVLLRLQGERALPLAVSLADFAHRPETEGCPQAVCSVQDLCACYGISDGPGWAQERLEVSAETLSRIDPSWNCFECISGEHADALLDANEPEKALQFLDAQRALKAGAAPNEDAQLFCVDARISVLGALGRYEEAIALAERQIPVAQSKIRKLLPRAQRALMFARMGRFDESFKALPAWSECSDAVGLYARWAECAALLVRADRLTNDEAFGEVLDAMVTRLDENGAARTALEVAQRAGALAIDRGDLASARRCLAVMESAVPRLRTSLDALDRVRALREAIAGAKAE